jgi:hypothetical protein
MKKESLSDEKLSRMWDEFLNKYQNEFNGTAKFMLFGTVFLNLFAIILLVICFSANFALTKSFINQFGISFICFILAFIFSTYFTKNKKNIISIVFLIISTAGIVFCIVYFYLLLRTIG